jgi:ABC-2 type transport system ATP-binding protein
MITVQNLSFSYTPKQKLFSNLNLQMNKGHIYGLLGKNGAGKSTLLKNMIGLALPKSGSCKVNGTDVSTRPVSVLEDVYFLPEEIYVPSLTPGNFAASTGSFYPKFDKGQYDQYLKLLDIDPSAIMDKMSFGQQKKAMIAFGLATNTSLLIMDEPTNGLDIPSKTQFRKLIASVLTEERCIVISTHQVRDLDSLIDSLLVLHNRDIVVNCPVEDISDRLTFATYADTTGIPVLYEEDGIRGKNVILQNTEGNYSKTDLELLFNAIITGNQAIVDLLNKSAK